MEKVTKENKINSSWFSPDMVSKVEKWKAQPGDYIVAGYPKSGTTWVSAIILGILTDGRLQSAGMQDDNIPLLEVTYPGCPQGLDILLKLPLPRASKTHLHYNVLQRQVETEGAKVIAILRNPKDVLVSFFHFTNNSALIKAYGSYSTFHDFFGAYRENKLPYGDMFDWYRSWWEQRYNPKVLIVKYEDLIKDTAVGIRKMGEFFEKKLSDEAISSLVNTTSLEYMRKRISQNNVSTALSDDEQIKFFRKGKVGDWKNYFNEEEESYIDKKCDSLLRPVGLEFDYE